MQQSDWLELQNASRAVLHHQVKHTSFIPRLLEQFTQTRILQHRVEHAWFPRCWRKMTLSTRSLGLEFYNSKWSYQTLGVKWCYQCVHSDLNSSTHTVLLRDRRNIYIGERYSISTLLPLQSSRGPIFISIYLHQSIFSQYLHVNQTSIIINSKLDSKMMSITSLVVAVLVLASFASAGKSNFTPGGTILDINDSHAHQPRAVRGAVRAATSVATPSPTTSKWWLQIGGRLWEVVSFSGSVSFLGGGFHRVCRRLLNLRLIGDCSLWKPKIWVETVGEIFRVLHIWDF